ncbi:TauD/TfdA family dioxygenase [Fodinicurvata fenggangensis]|uniref:TauD/TfdA family dioxygenase n=1 Tax=Fodinicurvata fenggangensis TaxID=1121830 RepID=UPI00138DDE2A|nr:TauD/TfdA family dioxygenase [Fodinicurvata fenggangensis]
MIRDVRGAEDWSPDELASDDSWIIELDRTDRDELLAALSSGKRTGKDYLELCFTDFPIDKALSKFSSAMREVNNGRGIALVKGLPTDLEEDDFSLLTWGIGLHLGVARPQNKASNYLTPVRDAGFEYKTGKGRGYNTRSKLDFHTDFSDVVALSCLRTAKEGGESKVVSSYRCYRLLCEDAPNLAKELFEPFWYSRQWELAYDESPTYPCSVFSTHKSELFVRYVRKNITTAQEFLGVPRLSEGQKEALDCFDKIISSDDNVYSMWLEPGDLQLLNNFKSLHSRGEFTDHVEPERKRLLYRLWLSTPDSPELPVEWACFYRDVRAGAVRGGVFGENYGPTERAFDQRRAEEMGMLCYS